MPITKQDCIDLGFEEIKTFNIMNSLTFDLGRDRQLSIGCVGTPNEMLVIYEHELENPAKITDIVCLHNYDYDGFISKEKLEDIVRILKP